MLGSAHISKRLDLHLKTIPKQLRSATRGSNPFDALPAPFDWKLGKKGQSR